MLDWYDAIKRLSEMTGAERDAFVSAARIERKPTNAIRRPDSISSDLDFDNDAADEIPYSGQANTMDSERYDVEPNQKQRRPSVGRFDSDIRLERVLAERDSTSEDSIAVMAAASAYPSGSYIPDHEDERRLEHRPKHKDHHHSKKHTYVVMPPVNLQRSTSPSSWSSDEASFCDSIILYFPNMLNRRDTNAK